MSGFGAPGGRAQTYKPTPPERGSFPLDHDADCKHLISSYLRCLKTQSRPGTNSDECRQLAKGYLDCRMTHGLMAKDEWENLGLVFDAATSVDKDTASGGKAIDKKDPTTT